MIGLKNYSFVESPVKIRDVVGTPTFTHPATPMYVLFMLAKLLGPPTRKIISSTSEPKGQGNIVYTTWNAYPKIWKKCYEYSNLNR